MREEKERLLAVFRAQPSESRLIIRIALLTPAVLVLWQWLADFVLPLLAVYFIVAVATGLYGFALAYMTARMMHVDGHLQFESARQAQRILRGESRRPDPIDDIVIQPPTPIHSNTASLSVNPATLASLAVRQSFHQAHFLLEVEDEVLRARREGHEMALIAIEFTFPHGDPRPSQLEALSFEMARLSVNHALIIRDSLSISPTEYVFALPQSDRAAARDFVGKLVQAMGEYWCHFGLAVYPDDGTDARKLFDHVLQKLEDSHTHPHKDDDIRRRSLRGRLVKSAGFGRKRVAG